MTSGSGISTAPPQQPSTYADSVRPPTWQQQYPGGTLAPQQFGQEGQATGVAAAICGPVAAVAFARAHGRQPTVAEALHIASRGGTWDAGTGMHGPASEAALLTQMGVPNRLEPNPTPDAVIRDVQNGNPVILSSPGHYHYFVVTGYDPQSGLFDTGNTGTALKGGSRYRTWEDIGPQAALFMQEPTAQGPSTAADMSPQQGAPDQATSTTGGSVEAFIRQRAAAYGIDPDTAVAVANSEGGTQEWARQSDYQYKGQRETSYGPMQLLIGGGLGDTFMQETGLDPRDPKNGPAATDWALKYASQHGWGDWHGAQRLGLDNYAGIGATTPTGTPLDASAFDASRSGGNQGPFGPAEQPYTPGPSLEAQRETDRNPDWQAPINASLDRARQGLADLGAGIGSASDAARGVLGSVADTASGAYDNASTIASRATNPATYAQSAGDVASLAGQSASGVDAALQQAYRDSPRQTVAGITNWVRTGDTSGLDDPIGRYFAAVAPGSGVFPVVSAAWHPILETGVGGAISRAEGATPTTQQAQQRFEQLPGWLQTATSMVLDPGNVIGAGQGEAAAGRAIEGAASEVGNLGEGLRAPNAPGIGRQVGRGLEVLGQGGVRGGAEDVRPPVAAAEPATAEVAAATAKPRAGYIGNINVEKLDPGVRDVVRQIHDADPAAFEQARRGVISDPQVAEMAQQINVDDIVAAHTAGTPYTAEEATALRYAAAKAWANVKSMAEEHLTLDQAGKLTDEHKAQFAEAWQQARQLQQAVTGAAAEAGRTLRSFRSPYDESALVNWTGKARQQVEDAFLGAEKAHDEIATEALKGATGDERAAIQAAIADVRNAAQDGYQAALDGVEGKQPQAGAGTPETAPGAAGGASAEGAVGEGLGAGNGPGAGEGLGAGRGAGEGGAAVAEPEMRPLSEQPTTDTNGRPLTRAQRMALERDRIRREFALARFGKRLEETTTRERQVIEAAAKRAEEKANLRERVLAEQERIRQEFSLARFGKRAEELTAREQTRLAAVLREQLARIEAKGRQAEQALNLKHERELAAQEQRIAAQEGRKGYRERVQLENQRAAAKDSARAQAERTARGQQLAHERALRAAEQRHHEAMVKLMDAITDPARRNRVRQLVNVLGGKNKNLTPWQRALRAVKQAQSIRATQKPDAQQKLYKNLIKAVTGTDDPAEASRRIQSLRQIVASGDTVQMGKLLQESQQPKFGDYIQSYYVANLLSAPATHIRNILGNTLSMALSPVEHGLSTLADAPLSALQGRARERFAGEIPQMLNGWRQSIPEAASRFADIMRYGFDPNDLERLANVRGELKGPIGTFANPIFRGLGGMDAFFGHMVYAGQIRSLAYRTARMEGLRGDALTQRTAELINAPTTQIIEEAARAARYRTFHQEMDSIGQALKGLHKIPGMNKIMPFINTPYNIVKFDLERTPYASAKIAWDVAKGQYHGPEAKPLGDLSDRLGRLMLGTIILYGGGQLYEGGTLTGNGPTEPGARDLWLRDHQPNSVLVGGHWVSWTNMPAVSTNLGMLTGALDAQTYGKGDVGEAAAAGAVGMLRAITQRSFMQGIAQLFDAVSPGGSPVNMAARLASSTASGFIPASALVRRTAQGLDTQVKQPVGTVQQFTQNLPGLSQGVQPRLDRSGRPITRDTRFMGQDFPGSSLLGSLVNPAITDTPENDPAIAEYAQLGAPFPGAGSRVAGTDLTPEQQYRYQQVLGQVTTATREQVRQRPDYQAANDAGKQDLLDQADAAAARRARQAVEQEFGIRPAAPDHPPKFDPRVLGSISKYLTPEQQQQFGSDPYALERAVGDASRVLSDYRTTRGQTRKPTPSEAVLSRLDQTRFLSREYRLWERTNRPLDAIRRQQMDQAAQDALSGVTP